MKELFVELNLKYLKKLNAIKVIINTLHFVKNNVCMMGILDILNQSHEVNWSYIYLDNKTKGIVAFSLWRGKLNLL